MNSLDVTVYEAELCEKYDLFIAACGYEQRCTNAAEKIYDKSTKNICFRFSDRLLHHFNENLDWFKSHGFEILSFEENCEEDLLKNLIMDQMGPLENDNFRVAVDYSSMDRKMIAMLVLVLTDLVSTQKVNAHFLYSPSQYSPPEEKEQFISISEPVLPAYAGKLADPNLPTVALAGIGYEFERTIGVLEYLEPAKVKVFIPEGCDDRFDAEVMSLNADLFEFIGEEDLIKYQLQDVFGLFKIIESMCYGLLSWSRPVMVPLGPKPFTLVSLIVSSIYDRAPVVWRVSDDQNAPPSDRIALGPLVCLGMISAE